MALFKIELFFIKQLRVKLNYDYRGFIFGIDFDLLNSKKFNKKMVDRINFF